MEILFSFLGGATFAAVIALIIARGIVRSRITQAEESAQIKAESFYKSEQARMDSELKHARERCNELLAQIEAVKADTQKQLQAAKENAAAAGKNYKDKDVKIVGGIVNNIDSDLKYFTLDGTDKNFSMLHVSCQIDKQNKELQDAVLNIKKGQPVIVYGHIKDVGDIMGYTLKLDKIEVNN